MEEFTESGYLLLKKPYCSPHAYKELPLVNLDFHAFVVDVASCSSSIFFPHKSHNLCIGGRTAYEPGGISCW